MLGRSTSTVPRPKLRDVMLGANALLFRSREPGHEAHECYATNLPGAENVCAWAEHVGCQRIIFTSSIAPYGPTEENIDERSLPVPISHMGHQSWWPRKFMMPGSLRVKAAVS